MRHSVFCALAFLSAHILSAQSLVFSEHGLPEIRTSLADKGYFGKVKEYRRLGGAEREIYNENGFLIEELVSIPTNGSVPPQAAAVRTLYAYDEAGALARAERGDETVAFKYESGRIVEEEHSEGDTRTSKIFYFYDRARLKEKRIYKGTGEFSHSYVYSYNRQGDVQDVAKKTSRPDSEIEFATSFIEYYYEYDSGGRKTLQAWGPGGSANKARAEVENFAYAAGGRLLTKSKGSFEENISGYKFLKRAAQAESAQKESAQIRAARLDAVTRWFYSPDGTLREESTHERSGHVALYLEKRQFEYDGEGRLLKEVFFQNGVKKTESEYERDEYGNVVRIRIYEFKDNFGEITRTFLREEAFEYTYIQETIPDEEGADLNTE